MRAGAGFWLPARCDSIAGELLGGIFVMCGCSSDQLCGMCLESRFMQLKGVAASRAHRWVHDLARRVPASHQWPAGSERMLRLAKCEVSDLAKDARLLEMLAKECVEAAEREWNGVAAPHASEAQ
jgi:hypothetical protein